MTQRVRGRKLERERERERGSEVVISTEEESGKRWGEWVKMRIDKI